MRIPVQITLRHMDSSPALEDRIKEEAERLEKFHPQIMSCRVVVEAPHKHHRQGQLFHLHIDVKVPGKEFAISRAHHDKHAYEDIYVSIRDAFQALQRKLQEHSRMQRGKVKRHEVPLHGRVLGLMNEYGKIETTDGHVTYFHRNSVLGDLFDELEVGSEVRFVEEQGDEGPQATTVAPLGKHHILDARP